MNYIVTVKYDPGTPKQYLVSADSEIAAKKEFIRQNGYDPGVPISAVLAGETLSSSMQRLNAVFQKLTKMADTVPITQPSEERNREDRAVRG